MERIKVNLDIQSSEDILNEMYQEYLSCPKAIAYLHKLGLSDDIVKENIAKIYDFVSDLKYCANCPGVDNCKKENPLLITKVTYNGKYLDREIIPCKKFLQRVEFQNQFVMRDFNESYLKVKISGLDKNEKRAPAVNKYLQYTKNKIGEWIYLSGAQNTGRSFLAAVFARDAAEKKLGPIAFLNCSKRINELTDLYFKNKDRFKEQLEMLSNIPILVLDDFGNEMKNDVVRDAIVFPILSTRASKKLFTIITSDFSISDIVNLYSTSEPGKIRAKQIGNILKAASGKEINLGDLAIY